MRYTKEQIKMAGKKIKALSYVAGLGAVGAGGYLIGSRRSKWTPEEVKKFSKNKSFFENVSKGYSDAIRTGTGSLLEESDPNKRVWMRKHFGSSYKILGSKKTQPLNKKASKLKYGLGGIGLLSAGVGGYSLGKKNKNIILQRAVDGKGYTQGYHQGVQKILNTYDKQSISRKELHKKAFNEVAAIKIRETVGKAIRKAKSTSIMDGVSGSSLEALKARNNALLRKLNRGK